MRQPGTRTGDAVDVIGMIATVASEAARRTDAPLFARRFPRFLLAAPIQ
jgi:hypothetical protein